PPALAQAVKRPAIFPWTVDCAGGAAFRAACAHSAAARSARPPPKLYTGIYMFRVQIALIAVCLFGASSASAASFSGDAALEYARHAVGFGPRPSGSEANKKLQAYILEQTRVKGAQVTEDSFVAKTPRGQVPMTNIIVKFPGTSGKAIAITGHFDTKYFPGRRFVGANDGAEEHVVVAREVLGGAVQDEVGAVFERPEVHGRRR